MEDRTDPNGNPIINAEIKFWKGHGNGIRSSGQNLVSLDPIGWSWQPQPTYWSTTDM